MDLKGQLTFNDNPLLIKFNEGLSYIQKGNFQKTLEIMEEIFSQNQNFSGVVDTIKSVKFWQNRWNQVSLYSKGVERANYLLREWKNYENFILKSKIEFERVVIAIKNFIFKAIIKNLILNYQEYEIPNIDILIKIGEIFIEIEEYKKALETLEYARMFKKKDSYLLSLLGEVYYHLGEEDKSKIAFKEAFLYDPQNIKLNKIKAKYIHKILDEIKQTNKGVDDYLLLEWIPVYGVLMNVFNVTKELNESDFNKILQEVQDLENEFFNKRFYKDTVEPKLINRYFWLLDYYSSQMENNEYFEMYLKKLKDINEKIYQKYISFLKK